EKKDKVASKAKIDLAVFAHNLMNQILYKIPDDMDLKNFEIQFRDDSNALKVQLKSAVIADGQLESTILVDTSAVWHLNGKMHPSDREIDVRLFADGKKVELPILEKKLGLKLNFDTIGTHLKNE